MRRMLSPLLLLCALPALAAPATRPLTVTHTGRGTITAIDVAPSGSDAWQPVAIGGKPLRNGDAANVRVDAGDACRVDVRVTYANDDVRRVDGFDLCRRAVLRTSQAK